MVVGILAALSVRDYCRLFGIENELLLCPDYDAMQSVYTALAVTHIIEVGVAVLLYLYFVFHICKPRQRIHDFVLETERRQQEAFLWRCWCNVCCALTSICCCCLLGGREVVLKADFGELSLVLADFFDQGNNKNGDPILDVTASDWYAGLIMLSAEQEEQRLRLLQQIRKKQADVVDDDVSNRINDDEDGSEKLEEGGTDDIRAIPNHRRVSMVSMQLRRSAIAEYYYEMTERVPLECSNADDSQLMHDGAHFMRLALAVYGYIQYIFQRPCTAPCCLTAATLSCQSCRRTYNDTADTEIGVVNGDYCGCDENALFQVSGLDSEDLVYTSFQTGVGMCPYCIVIERTKKAVVVVVRGTMSLEAAVTDLMISPEAFDDHSDDVAGLKENPSTRGEYCHSGMLNCAKWMYKDLERHKLLNRLLLGDASHFSNFKLVICGHSLGAGIAAVLSCMLKPQFPSLTGLCFEPPGCVLSKNAAAQECITSFVLNADIIPRLSLQSLEYIRNDTLEMIARIKVPKHKVRATNLRKAVEEKQENGDNDSALRPFIHRRQSIPESTFRRELESFHRYQDELAQDQGREFRVKLFPPGRIIHLVKSQESSTSGLLLTAKSVEYTPIWAPAEDFAKIQISRSFAADHDPQTVLHQLEIASASFLRPPAPPNA